MGKLVICSDVDPSVELIRGNFNGVLFEKDNSRSLSETIVEVVSNLDRFREIGNNSRQWVQENRDWNEITGIIEELYSLLRFRDLARSRQNRVREISQVAGEILEGHDSIAGIDQFCSMIDYSISNFDKRTSRNLFLGLLRALGKNEVGGAVIFGERYIGDLGDSRSIKSMTAFYKIIGVKETDQLSRIRENVGSVSEDVEELVRRENKKIKIKESPYFIEFNTGEILKIDESEDSVIITVSGTLICSRNEGYSAALIQFSFYDENGQEVEEEPLLLSSSKRVGWYSYLNQNPDNGEFMIEFIPPPGTKRILAGVRTWNNLNPLYILPEISVGRSSLEEFILELERFCNIVSDSKSNEVVFMFSGTTYVQDVRANRPIRMTKNLLEREIPVLFNYHRWNRREEIPEHNDDFLLQIPIDITERLLGNIAEMDFGDKKKIFIISYPHPSISKILNRYRALGWVTIYDARDEWEEFEKVGQAKWYNIWNEKYIVHNVDHVTAVSWPLANKLDGFEPGEQVEVVPNALSPHFLSPDYKKKRTDKNKVGYFGHLTDSWFDWESLANIARLRPDYQFDIIGHSEPEDLVLPDNVIMLGPKTHPEINEIATEWNVAIIPFKMGKLSDSVDPIKIYEYLALGLPTVSFRMPQIDNYPYTKTVENIDDFCSSLDLFIQTEIDQNEISKWLENNTWGERVGRILEKADSDSKDGIRSIGE